MDFVSGNISQYLTISSNSNNDPIWMNDMTILLDSDRLTEFIPNRRMSYNRKSNALIRFATYIGVVLAVFNQDYLYLYVPITVMIISYVLYYFKEASDSDLNENDNQESQSEQEQGQGQGQGQPNLLNNAISQEEFQSELQRQQNNSRQGFNGRNLRNRNASGCRKPTPRNPFMNVMPGDDFTKPAACKSHNNQTIQNKINEHFDANLFKDVSDIFNNRNSQREFITMPSTTIPNDQTAFAKWLYLSPPTCKEGNGAQCVANNYERLEGRTQNYIIQ